MTDFSKCCGGNDEHPQQHCTDCARTWGRTKKELVELIERERAESKGAEIAIRAQLDALKLDVGYCREMRDTQRATIVQLQDEKVATKTEVIDRLGRDLDEARKDVRTTTDHADRWSSELTAERAAHKTTRERLAMELKQVAVDKLLIEDLESRREFWQKKSVGAVFWKPDPLAYPVVERGPHAPVGARRDFEPKCDCRGTIGSIKCNAAVGHENQRCGKTTPPGSGQCADCFMPF